MFISDNILNRKISLLIGKDKIMMDKSVISFHKLYNYFIQIIICSQIIHRVTKNLVLYSTLFLN